MTLPIAPIVDGELASSAFGKVNESFTDLQATDTVARAAVQPGDLKTINSESLVGVGDITVGGLTQFEEARSVAAPNATVPAHAIKALGAETNIDFVINAKGTGAILAQVPDNTTVGGNKRGTGAVDLQTSRQTAQGVASGLYSVAMGQNNTASGYAAVALGLNSTASGSAAVAIGWDNIASGAEESVAIGKNNAASNSGSIAIGRNNTASGAYSAALGFRTSTRVTTGAMSEGYSEDIGLPAPGRQQMERIPLRFDTTDASSTRLTSNGAAPGSTNVGVMPNNSAYYCRLRVLARNTATGESMSWSGTALIKRGANAASTTLIGSTISSDFGDAALSTATVTLSADTTLGALAVSVTGLAGTTVRWVAQLETVEAA